MISADDAEYPREYRTLGNGTRRFSNVGLVHTSERRHTVIAAQSLEALTGLQKSEMERKRDAFMDHLKNKYPQHALALRGQQERMRDQVRGIFSGLGGGHGDPILCFGTVWRRRSSPGAWMVHKIGGHLQQPHGGEHPPGLRKSILQPRGGASSSPSGEYPPSLPRAGGVSQADLPCHMGGFDPSGCWQPWRGEGWCRRVAVMAMMGSWPLDLPHGRVTTSPGLCGFWLGCKPQPHRGRGSLTHGLVSANSAACLALHGPASLLRAPHISAAPPALKLPAIAHMVRKAEINSLPRQSFVPTLAPSLAGALWHVPGLLWHVSGPLWHVPGPARSALAQPIPKCPCSSAGGEDLALILAGAGCCCKHGLKSKNLAAEPQCSPLCYGPPKSEDVGAKPWPTLT